MKIRLQKLLAQCGIASRRSAEKIISKGLVRVNNKIETQLGVKADPKLDSIFFKNKKLNFTAPLQLVFALYKPKNCITSLKDEKNREIITKYFPKTHYNLFPIGRLDYNSEGLILITNDGDFAQKISHPSHQCQKTYLVKIKKILGENELKIINKPMMLDKKLCRAKVKHLHNIGQNSWVRIDLRQGINLQIKRMFGALKINVLKIKRIQIGNIHLKRLKVGESRQLTKIEIKSLLNFTPTKIKKISK